MKVPTTLPDRPVVRLRDFTFSHKAFLNLQTLKAFEPLSLLHVSNEPGHTHVRVIDLDLTNYHDVVKLNG